jgi:hypothetical protein
MQSKERSLSIGQTVYVQNFGSGPKWVSGHIVAKETSSHNSESNCPMGSQLQYILITFVKKKHLLKQIIITERVPLTPQVILPPIVRMPVHNQPSPPSDTQSLTGNTAQSGKENFQNHAGTNFYGGMISLPNSSTA